MLIHDENNRTIILNSILTPTLCDYFWVLDLAIKDFTLAPLTMLEETTGPAITLNIQGFEFTLPAKWGILVQDHDTTFLDYIEVSNIPGRDFTAMVYGPDMARPNVANVSAIDFHPNHVAVSPSLNKNQMLCHPIAPDKWVMISPSDPYNKYLKNALKGDIV